MRLGDFIACLVIIVAASVAAFIGLWSVALFSTLFFVLLISNIFIHIFFHVATDALPRYHIAIPEDVQEKINESLKESFK